MRSSKTFQKSIFLNVLKNNQAIKLLVGVLVFFFSLQAGTPSIASTCPNNNIVQNPQEFQWTYHPVTTNNPNAYYSGVMEVGKATFTINGETLTTRAYRQKGSNYSIPGPTIKVVPGNKYVIRLNNTLPYEPLSPSVNVFKDPNVVNLHTHGLHISGESPGDDITRSFEGGFGGDFVYDIPADHMGGTYWYHAHHHGSSFLQVSGGMFGMLIVDDSADGIPSNVAAMTEREMIFGFLDPAAAGTGGDQLMSGTLSPTWTINGLVEGNICMPPNTWQHWRVLLADRNSNIKTIEFGAECEVMLLGRDGVWRTVAPKSISSNALEMTGASRSDFAIRTTGDSWVRINGTTVANIYANGIQDSSVHPFDTDGVSTWSAIRPNYLRDLRNEINVHNESISMGARTINGSKYNHSEPNLSLPTTQVQEWSLSGAVQHPFHLHIYHVQALANDGDFEAGEYYDVVSAKMSVRFDLNQATSSPYSGRTILHCHILSHEDRGAMGWLDVNGGAAPPSFPSDGDLTEPYSVYYSLGGVQQPPTSPSNLEATNLSSSAINLSWIDNSADEDGFDVERSIDGSSFVFIASVGPDIVSYIDDGLTASTTYYYRVSAFNSIGISAPSNEAIATTQSSGGGSIIHVEDISVVRESVGRNRSRGVATITIHDNLGSAVSGAIVNGNFSGSTTSTESGTTDIFGQVSINSSATRNPSGEWCFEVTNINLTGATYDPADNVVTQACESNSAANISLRGYSNGFRFMEVYPNPFQNTINIAFQLPQQSNVVMEIYSLLGTRVAVITDRDFKVGKHLIEWNTQLLSSGTYFLKLKAGKHVETRRLMHIR
jgi:FtsP/CotA-like multicopper oxidase with cupredoxin domain